MTPTRTPFAGLEQLAPGDPLSSDGFAFQFDNPAILDVLTKIGAVTHRHDEHVAMANPTTPPDLSVLGTGGSIPAGTPIYVLYTLIDPDGGETIAVDPIVASTPGGFADPTDAPTAVPDYLAGTLLANVYSYVVTVTDGLGGETAASPSAEVVVESGNANAEVAFSGLTAIVDASSGSSPTAGWRLWRSVGGSPWYLIATGGEADDTFTDTGIGGDCTVQPPDVGSTGSTGSFTVTVPSLDQPADAQFYRIYASDDGTFTSPCFLAQYPAASFGTVHTFTDLTVGFGAPPAVSRCYPGASKIDALTEIIHLYWKAPVATAADLPMSDNSDGDIRLVKDSLTILEWNGSAWVDLSTGHFWGAPVASATDLPATAVDGEVHVALDTDSAWVFHQAAIDILVAVGVAAGPSQLCGLAFDDTHIYWTANDGSGAGRIGRANLDGSSPSSAAITVIDNLGPPVLDGSFIYWATNSNTSAGGGRIGRANLDLTGVNNALVTVSNLGGAFVVGASHLYWTAGIFGEAIGRSNLDGSSPDAAWLDLSDASYSAIGVTSDGTYLYYWGGGGGIITIGRVATDGSGRNDSFIVVTESYSVFAVDATHIYLQSIDKIARAAIDGSGFTVLLTAASTIRSAAVDDTDTFIFWSVDESIGRMNLDGSSQNAHYIDAGMFDIDQLAVLSGVVYWEHDPIGDATRMNIYACSSPNAWVVLASPSGVSGVDSFNGRTGDVLPEPGDYDAADVGAMPFYVSSSQQSGDYTFALTDAATVVESTDASAATYTVPANADVAFPIGTVIEVFQFAAGQVTIVGAFGVNVRSDGARTKTAAQYASIGLRKRDTDEWVLTGDLA